MATPFIVYDNVSWYSITGSVVADSSYPFNNLNTDFARDKWKSSSTTGSQWLSIDIGSSGGSKNSIAIDTHNIDILAGSATCSVQAADDSSYSTGLTSILSSLSSSNQQFVQTFPSITKRYWRILYSGTLSEVPYIGNVVLSNRVDFTTAYDFNYHNESPQFNTESGISLDGTVRTSQINMGRLVYELTFNCQDDTLLTKYQLFQQITQGRRFSFFFVDADGVVRRMKNKNDFNPLEVTFYQKNKVQLQMQTQTKSNW